MPVPFSSVLFHSVPLSLILLTLCLQRIDLNKGDNGDMYMNGKIIIKYRTDNCISQSELAERVGVSKSTLSRWENDKSEPRGDEYKRLREVIGDEYFREDIEDEPITTESTIGEMSNRVNDILYEVTKIESKQDSFEKQKMKSDLFHKRLRTVVVIVTCIIILLIVVITWLWLVNFGFGGKYVEGSARLYDTSVSDDN